MRPAAIKVTPIEDHKLLILFDNNEQRVFDATPLIKGSWFGELTDEDYFAKVRISGLSVEWPDGQDICPDDLYYLSVPAEK